MCRFPLCTRCGFFAETHAVHEIVVALRKDEIAGFRAQLEKQYPEILRSSIQIVEGGEHRQDSVTNALANSFCQSG